MGEKFPESQMAERWLVIDDSATIQRVIKLAFQDFNVAITEAESCPEASQELARVTPTLVIADAALAGVQSVQDFVALQQIAPSSIFVILEGSYDHIDEAQFRSAGFRHFLKKPFDAAQLIATTRQALGRNIPKRGEERIEALPTEYFVSSPEPQPQDRQADQPRGILLDPADDGSVVDELIPAPNPELDKLRFGRFAEEQTQSGTFSPSAFDLGLDDGSKASKISPANFSLDEDDADDSPKQADPNPYQSQIQSPAQDPNRAFERTQRDFGTNSRDPLPNARVDAPNPTPTGWEGLPNASLSGMLEPMLHQEMEKLVRAAVEDYCRRNFAELARELIVRELDRLTQERSRLLVDK
jgi:CheY-like chemotaxis protein